MSPFLNFFKDVLETVKKKNRLIVGASLLMVGYLGETVYEVIKEEVITITKTDRKIYELDGRVTTIETKLNKFNDLEDQLVTRPSFNAYIARKDDEFHLQETFNDVINKDVGELTGKVDMLEKIYFMDVQTESCKYKKSGC